MEYQVTSPTGKKYRVTAPEGATQDQVLSYAQSQFGHLEDQLPAEKSDDQLLRKTALGGRAIGEGVASAASFASDQLLNNPDMGAIFPGPQQPLAALSKAIGLTPVQMMLAAARKISGKDIPDAKNFQELLGNTLTGAGAPVPETAGENLGYQISKGAAAALTGGVGGGLTGANALRAGISGATGGGASELTKQAGGGPVAQTIAGLAGGIAPGVAGAGSSWMYQTAKNAGRPLLKSGQQQMAANLMASEATNPQAAEANLRAAEEIIPGSPRTMGEASQDPGLMALEKGLRNKDMAAFAPTISAQNTAQQKALGNLAGTPNDIVTAQNARDIATAPMREAALNNPVGRTIGAPVNFVTEKIDEILNSPVGERQVINKALTDFKSQIAGKTDPARLYEIRKDINDAMMGKLGGEKSVYSLARKELGDVKDTIDNVIESAAPGFKAYLVRYKEMSKPINQMEALQEIQQRAQLTSMDAMTREQFLSPSVFSRAVDAALADPKTPITNGQIETLKAIRTDLQYGQALNSRLIKPAGSDTFQNLSIAQVLGAGQSTTHPMMRIVSKPLQWLYKAAGTDNSVNEILKAAAIDPKLAAGLLSRATPKAVESFSQSLRMKAISGSLGAAAQLSAMQSRWTEDTNRQAIGQAVAP